MQNWLKKWMSRPSGTAPLDGGSGPCQTDNDVNTGVQPERRPSTSSAIAALRAQGVPVETVLDVGVQHGSPELCKACPDLHHVLFEPVVEFQKSIAWVYRDIRHEVVSAAVSNLDGETDLEVNTMIPGADISHSTIVDDASSKVGSVLRRVPLVTLDAFLAKRADLQAPYLLKIDIDGFELRVLAGAKEILRKCSVIIVELNIDPSVFSFTERFMFLQNSGFQLADIVDLAYYRGNLAQVDGVFVRDDLRHLLVHSEPFDFNYWQNFS